MTIAIWSCGGSMWTYKGKNKRAYTTPVKSCCPELRHVIF